MNVCHLTLWHHSGDTRIHIKECASLAKEHRVFLLTPHRCDETDSHGVHVLGTSEGWKGLRKMLRRLFSLMREFHLDLLHIHDPKLLPLGATVKMLTGCLLVFDDHENHPLEILANRHISPLQRRLKAFIARRVENFLVRFFCDGVVAATDDIASSLGFHPLTACVRNHPRLDMFTPVERYDEVSTIVYVGGLTEARGIKELMEATKRVEGIRLLLYGGIQDENIREAVESADGDKISFEGPLPYDHLPGALRKGEIGAVLYHPVRQHIRALPNKMFEYMAAGLCVLASDFPLWRRLVEENGCGVCVDPTSPEAIAEALEYLKSHPSEAAEMGRRAREMVERRWNWRNQAEVLMRLYHLLDPKDRGRKTA